ncbi:MAG: TlyA family RNA methyltransferase [Clostridia bacterium]|nr:TlyA family RNA methyltransferase [Clostridia bacterium]
MRIDAFLFSAGKFVSRNKATEAIERGEVFVNGKQVLKPSFSVDGSEDIKVIENGTSFVSNGGYKLEKAFQDFNFSANGLTFIDVGASTGGFTDCLLKRGAKKVYAIDVGESLLSNDLKTNDKVVLIDNFNARNLSVDVIGEKVDGVVCDVSFISLTYVLSQIYSVLKDDGFAVVLIKPQFECGKKQLNKNGIVTDKKARVECVKKIIDYSLTLGFKPSNFTFAPIKPDKNREYLLFLSKGERPVLKISNIEYLI